MAIKMSLGKPFRLVSGPIPAIAKVGCRAIRSTSLRSPHRPPDKVPDEVDETGRPATRLLWLAAASFSGTGDVGSLAPVPRFDRSMRESSDGPVKEANS